MRGKTFTTFPGLGLLLIFLGCATTTPPSLPPGNSPVIPLGKANLQAVLDEQEGLEMLWENAKDLRDFYRGGVQKKAEAEKKFREKDYPEALKLYDSSDEFLLVVIKNNNQDDAEFPLYEGASILFFPNLLMADNKLKMGLILREMGHESAAQRKWKEALPYIEQSLRSERTEWGLSLQQKVLSLLNSQKG
jgi:hypothetical protein